MYVTGVTLTRSVDGKSQILLNFEHSTHIEFMLTLDSVDSYLGVTINRYNTMHEDIVLYSDTEIAYQFFNDIFEL